MNIKETVKRIAKDVKDILNNPLNDNYIYYHHDEENILKGYAMIYGAENTPYSYGNYLFEFNFPRDYPYNPPTLKFLTNGDRIRMNPNLYRDGKVCISILNTWKGEQWSSCQTIKSILLSLLMIFNDKPLLNEPGFTETHSDFKKYNDILYYKNIDIGILKVMKYENLYPTTRYFKNIIKENFLNNYKKILDVIEKKSKVKCTLEIETYNMIANIDYDKLKEDIIELYNNLK